MILVICSPIFISEVNAIIKVCVYVCERERSGRNATLQVDLPGRAWDWALPGLVPVGQCYEPVV